MILKRNEVPTSDIFSVDYLKLTNISDDTHSSILSSLNNANIMYNNSSVMEDIILEDFLSLYTQAKDIDFVNKNKNRVTESFLTTQYSDGSFNVKNRLNIDTQNGNIILPIIATTDLPVDTILIESDSNGAAGNSLNGGINSDINVILDSQSLAMFEYEKIAASTDDSNLVLSLMFSLANPTVTNGIYIQLFTSDSGVYPTIDIVDISLDGVIWESIDSSTTASNLNKSDYFLRFLPQNIKYIRIRFIQQVFDSIKTIFGYRYRSVIGVRQITFKQVEYDTTADYVSIPYSIGGAINAVTFNYSDISNGDITYLISGNNGSKWIPVKSNGSTISVTNENAGIMDGNEVATLRVKMTMDKAGSVLNKINATEYLSISPNNKYYLKQVPQDVNIYCGRHISFGREIRYICERESVPMSNFLLRYIPFTDPLTMSNYLRVYVDGVLQNPTAYYLIGSSNPNNCEINFITPVEGNAQVSVDFKEVTFRPLDNAKSNIIKLPINMFYTAESDIIVKETPIGSVQTILSPDQYKIISSNQIQIQNSTFKSTAMYSVSYIPSFQINNSYTTSMNEIEISAMYPYDKTMLRFDYTYQNIYDATLIKYYTPIGLEYTMEIQ